MQPYPSSFTTLITSYLEEGLIESALDVMDVLVRVPGFYPPQDLIEDLILAHVLRSKSIRKSAAAMALLSRLPQIYPPDMLGLFISQKPGPHDTKRFWQIFVSEIVPVTHGVSDCFLSKIHHYIFHYGYCRNGSRDGF